jgi:hypothetical protein
VIAIILGFAMGMAGVGLLKLAFLTQLFVMIMLIIWAFSDFCPSLYLLKQVIPSCHEDKNQQKE